MNIYRIIFNKNHYELYYNDKFICSADTLHEIEQDKEEYEKERKI